MHLSWNKILSPEKKKDYFKSLRSFIKKEKQEGNIIYPPMKDVYNAFNCPFDNVKVVIVGQDPYHGPNQAHGISFSVKDGCKIPPSLKNIFKELSNDIDDFVIPDSGNLSKWQDQGVLLLNTILTVRQGEPGSHKNQGWEKLTKRALKELSKRGKCVFVLWGAFAQSLEYCIDEENNFIIKAPHPSPFSVHKGFFGSKPFSKINNKLKEWGLEKIDWRL